MKPTRRTKLDRLLHEILTDDNEDRSAIAADLRTWAFRLEANANAGAWNRPNLGGRPRERGLLDDDEPAFLHGLFEHFAGLVRALRPLARRARNPATFRDRVPSGRDLLVPFPSGDVTFQEMFRQRFAVLAADLTTPPQLAAAQLVLWYGQADDSSEEAARLVERFKKRGKTPA